jgi:hypothetical protein
MRLVWNDCVRASLDDDRSSRERLTPERLFEALDGRRIVVLSRTWQVEIYSVRAEGDATWLQLGLTGDPSFNLLMRMAPDEGPKHAVHILSSWLANPKGVSHVVNVS